MKFNEILQEVNNDWLKLKKVFKLFSFQVPTKETQNSIQHQKKIALVAFDKKLSVKEKLNQIFDIFKEEKDWTILETSLTYFQEAKPIKNHFVNKNILWKNMIIDIGKYINDIKSNNNILKL